jgi:hypothetical protein
LPLNEALGIPKGELMKSHLGTIVGFIGIILSIYFYSLSKHERVPVFKADISPTLIAFTDGVNGSNLKIIDSDGVILEGQVWSLGFVFYNVGKLPIKNNEVLKELKISLTDENSKILDFRINEQRRADITKGELIQSETSILLKYKILEQDDYIRGQIIFNGNRDDRMVLSGILEGVKEIHTSEPTNWSLLLFNIAKYSLITFSVLALFLLGVSLIIFGLAFIVSKLPSSLIGTEKKKQMIATIKLQNVKGEKDDKYIVYKAIVLFVVLVFGFSYLQTHHPDRFRQNTLVNEAP